MAMWYASANRDETHFPDPYRFDLCRDPNPQVGYGAGGPHFCLGANLARREITLAFRELFEHVPDLHAVAEPDMLLSPFIHGIKRLECEFTPRERSRPSPWGSRCSAECAHGAALSPTEVGEAVCRRASQIAVSQTARRTGSLCQTCRMTDDIEASMVAFQRAVEERDEALAGEVLDDDFCLVLVAPSRAVMARARWLEVLKDYTVHEYSVDEFLVDEDRDCAVALHRVRMRATVLGQDRSGTFVITDVWRKRDGRWRLWRRHSTPFSAAAMPGAVTIAP